MSDDLNFTVESIPAIDTGLGREAGYESDAAMIAAHEAEVAKMPAPIREAIQRAEQELVDKALYGNAYRDANGERIDPRDVQS